MKERVEQIDGHLYRVRRDKNGHITSKIACDPSQNGNYIVQDGELRRTGPADRVIIDVR